MQFAGDSDDQDLVDDIDGRLGTNSTTFPIKAKTRYINNRYHLIWTIIFESYGGARFMDDNLSDTSTGVPYSDQTLTSGSGLYGIPSASLTVDGLYTYNGTSYTKLKPLSVEEFHEAGGDSHWTSNGVPEYYMQFGDVFRLLPVPNFTQSSNGLRTYYDPKIQKFASTDTSVVPGFAETFHVMLSIGACIDYAEALGLEKKRRDNQEAWNRWEVSLRAYYARKFKEKFPVRIGGGPDLVDEFS